MLDIKPYKVQAVAQLLGTSTVNVRRMLDESGIDVVRQEHGPKTRIFSAENIFDLARHQAMRKTKDRRGDRKQVVATVYAPKSAVGKTMLTGNFALCFGLRGLRTLSIDLDLQADLTLSFGYNADLTPEEAVESGIPRSRLVENHFGNLMPNWPMGRRTLPEVAKKPYGENGPHLVPADVTLDRLDAMLSYEDLDQKNAARDRMLAQLLQDGRAKKDPNFDTSEYDIVLFDAPSSTTRITRCALLASDFVICPVSMEHNSSKGLSYLSSVLAQMHDQFGRSPELIIVANFFDSASVHVMTQLSTVMQTYKQSLLQCWIRRSGDFPKAIDHVSDSPLVLSKPSCSATSDLMGCAHALLARMGMMNA